MAEANRMAETFAERRHDIVKNCLLVSVALQKYPELKDHQELRREFERVTRENLNKDFNLDNFEHHLEFILKQYAQDQVDGNCANDYCRDSVFTIQDPNQNNGRKISARMIIFGCAQSQGAWWNTVVKLIEEGGDLRIGRLEPTVLVRGSPLGPACADVYCEKIKVVEEVDFHEAILICYYLYWIFNIVYPTVDKEIFQGWDKLRRFDLDLKAHGQS